MALHPILFPIDQPVMPETRQIGRRSSIEALQAELAGAKHQRMIGERRTGKTSVAKAVLARLSSRSRVVALDVDLSSIRISSSTELAGELARQAQAAKAGSPPDRARQISSFARRHRAPAKRIGAVMQTFGLEDVGEALQAVTSLLAEADAGGPGLGHVLKALAIHAEATEEHVFVLLDEVHLIARLAQAEEALAEACHLADSPLVFCFAGSEESAARELREAGRPLAAVGHEFRLAAISPEDWLHGLRARFGEAGVEIENREIEAIVAASQGHPRRTMLIASNVHASVGRLPHATAGTELVDLAISDARSDRAWR